MNVASLLALYLVVAPEPAASPPLLARKLNCKDRVDYERSMSSDPFFSHLRMTSLGRRMEYLRVYRDGQVRFTVEVADMGSIDCEATLSAERLAAFRSELAQTKFWRAPTPERRSAREVVRLSIKLDEVRQCDFEMKPVEWAKWAVTRSVQVGLDQLKQDICGGGCPEPTAR